MKFLTLLIFLCLPFLSSSNNSIFHSSIIKQNRVNELEGSIPMVSEQPERTFVIDSLPAPGSPFHLAIPVHSMSEARNFYGGILGLKEGRRCDDKWQDYSLFGHQIVCHYVGEQYRCQDYYNPVDGDEVPVSHFGICLLEEEFHQLANKLKACGIQFIIEPHLRFQGQPGEQWTMFFKDPSNNNLEFKSLKNPQYLFARYNVIDNK